MEYLKEDSPSDDSNETQLCSAAAQNFRERYFNTNGEIESRQERRLRKAALREQGRLEMEMRGKLPSDGRAKKCDLNKARFN